MTQHDFLGRDGRSVIVAIDHPLYSWPCRGLEDRGAVIRAVAEAGADAIIASYGTIRDYRADFGKTRPILKLDVTTVTVGGSYPLTEYVIAYTLEDAQRLGVKSVLSYVQLGAPFELEAMRSAAELAARCDREGMSYLTEIMPIECAAYPDAAAPLAIAASCRAAAELGAHGIKTTLPEPVGGVAEAVAACNIPVIIAGGAPASDRARMFRLIEKAMAGGAAGVAFGRNVWGSPDPAEMVQRLVSIVHGKQGRRA